MRTTFERARLQPPDGGSVISIGVFDGVHLGHRAILEANVRSARARGAEAAVVTFRRHPKHLLLGRAPRTLTPLDHRLELFARIGIDHAVALTFDDELRNLAAPDFVRGICVEGLGGQNFVLGFDSKFGRDRGGTPASVAALGYDVEVVDKVLVHGRAVSSTAIREAVELGDLAAASGMLGRPVSVIGRVVRGQARGRELGFPTANLDPHHGLHPPPGVWASRIRILGSKTPPTTYDGVTNIGFRPTLGGERPATPLIEAHLFDFAGDLYGQRLEVEFHAFLRGERRFASLDELRSRIALDADEARRILAEPLRR